MDASTNATRVYLEIGKTCVFACAVDWPGWCRRGKGEQAALDAFADYTDRYARVAGPRFTPGEPVVVGSVPGTSTTDFGAPAAPGPWDDEPWDAAHADRQCEVLAAAWKYFDTVAGTSPAELRKGPRGGGRDRDAIIDHVCEAERGYAPKVGVRVPPRTPWPRQRALLLDALRADAPGGAWPARYSVRRLAWHVLDHAWEIEDRRVPAG